MSAVATLRGQIVDYRRVLLHRDYRLLWAAQVVSTFGDRLTQIALTTLVFALTGSDLTIGVVLTLTVLPRAVFGLFAGALADRVSRKSLLVATDLLRALIVAVFALAADLPLSAVYVLAALHATVSVFFAPTRYAVLPDIVPEHELLTANTLDETTQSALDPVAFMLGGAIVGILGAQAGFGIDTLTFLLSAALLMATTPSAARQWRARAGGEAGTAGLAAGLKVLWRDRVLRANTGLMMVAAGIASAELPLTYMLVFSHWDRGAVGLGVFEAVLAIGFVAGGLTCRPLVDRVGKGPAIVLGLVGTGVTMAIVPLLPFWPAVLVNGVSGAFNIHFFVPTITLHQERAPASARGRVMSARTMLMSIALAVSYAGATALTSVFSPMAVMASLGVLLAAGSLLAALIPEVRAR